MTTTNQTPEEIGADDLNSWISDQTINNPAADPAELAAEILGQRGYGHSEPDEALINAMGTGWILERLGLEDTEENWATSGLAWCERYNAGYWAAAQALAAPGAEAIADARA